VEPSVVPHLPDPSARDRWLSASHEFRNWWKLASLGLRVRPDRLVRALGAHPWLHTLLQVNRLHDRMTRARRGRYREAAALTISAVLAEVVDMLEGVYSRPDRVVLHEDLLPPEILFGMGLEPWMAEFLGIVLPMVNPPAVEPYIDTAEQHGIPPDVCSLPKSTLGLTLAGEMPRPVAMVTSNMPCDGGMSQYTLIERCLQVPTFRLDVPYHFHDERAVAYFAGQLERLIAWLEAHTPGRMDWDRLRRVCQERNRAVEHELELWDCLRARPAPMAAEPVYLSHLMFGIGRPGTPRGTEVFRRVAELARANLAEGAGALDDERLRVALWNPPTLIFSDLFAWAEPRWGAALVMDMLTYHRHPFVDTRTPQTMLRDLARIIMQGPMARHTRGPAENFFGDLFQFYEQLDLDTIWMAAHIGCKNTQALLGIFREQCRRRSIPLLIIDYDLSDTRVVSTAGIRDQVDRYLETVMRAERLDHSATDRGGRRGPGSRKP
jgi:hypothetical protein